MEDKYKRFCEEYIIDLNGTKAAIRAGYAESGAAVRACELLASPEVQEYIAELKRKRSERTEITADMVLKELARLGFSDISAYYDSGLTLKELSELSKDKTAAISQIKVTETEFEGGSKKTIEFKLHDKLSALEKISKHIGFYEKDNTQKKAEISPETLEEIAKKINGNAAG